MGFQNYHEINRMAFKPRSPGSSFHIRKHMRDLKGTLAVQFNFCLQSFSLYILLVVGLLLPVSLFLQNRGGLVNAAHGLHESGHEDCGWVSEMSPGSW